MRECYTFRTISNDNKQDILNLKLEQDQKHFIESPEECMKEAEEVPQWNPRGIYYMDRLIGFTMYGKMKEDNRVWLDRIMIDKKYQGQGHGRASLERLIELLFLEYGCDSIYLSLYDDNVRAMDLYKKLGFACNGELDTKGELVMKLHVGKQSKFLSVKNL